MDSRSRFEVIALRERNFTKSCNPQCNQTMCVNSQNTCTVLIANTYIVVFAIFILTAMENYRIGSCPFVKHINSNSRFTKAQVQCCGTQNP